MRSVDDYVGLNYRMALVRDDEGGYIAEAEELPGCMADGGTAAEAIDNLKDAMRSWITSRLKAGLEVPEPRGQQEFSGRFVVRMPRFLHARLTRQANAEGASLNHYVVSLLSLASANPAALTQDVTYLNATEDRPLVYVSGQLGTGPTLLGGAGLSGAHLSNSYTAYLCFQAALPSGAEGWARLVGPPRTKQPAIALSAPSCGGSALVA